MYMFFWFFKQLYYILKKIFHGGLFLLFLFFIFFIALFVCKGSYAFTFEENGETITVVDPPFTITDSTLFMFGHYSNQTQYLIGTPVNPVYQDKFLVSYNEGGASQNTFRYRTDSSHYGEWYWYTLSSKNATSWSSRNTTSHQYLKFNSGGSLLVSSLDVYSSDGNTLYFEKNYPSSVTPYITTTSSTVENWSFDYLTIYGGSYLGDTTNQCYLDFYYGSGTSNYTDINCLTYYDLSSNTINIPRSVLEQSYVIRTGVLIGFNLTVVNTTEGGSQTFYFNLGNYTLDLTSQEQQEINEDSNKQLLSDISNNQKETTQAINNLDNTITNPNIDNSSINLPTDNTNDITQDGINTIFTSIYNAFCVGQPQDIIFPIPFTNKNITLQANYIRDMLSNNGATWVITIIEYFWWYLISRFIIHDISIKINKIKSGNIEDIENSNIKGDML